MKRQKLNLFRKHQFPEERGPYESRLVFIRSDWSLLDESYFHSLQLCTILWSNIISFFLGQLVNCRAGSFDKREHHILLWDRSNMEIEKYSWGIIWMAIPLKDWRFEGIREVACSDHSASQLTLTASALVRNSSNTGTNAICLVNRVNRKTFFFSRILQ